MTNQAPTLEWRPEILDPRQSGGRERLEALFRNGAVHRRCDTLQEQLAELVALRRPDSSFNSAEIEELVRDRLGGRPALEYGSWIYYPWSGCLVHLLPQDEFREVRSDRNRNKITQEEQARLRDAIIGVVGLSVGQASALTMALEGVGGHFRLADFDRLGLSNLNRLRAGTHELGLNKSVLAARQMFEIDPYLDIEIYPEGLDDRSVEGFVGEGSRRLWVLVEECDDIYMKVRARELARERGVPVVMDTSDRGLIDVERFDLEPDRPLLHGLLGDIDSSRLVWLSSADRIPYILRCVGIDSVSKRMAQSLPELKRTISTWPQLASGVALGGALVTDVVRRVLLDEFTASGRYYVDIEALVANDAPSAA